MESLFRPRQDTKSRPRPRLRHLLHLPLIQTVWYPESPQSGNVWTVGGGTIDDISVHGFRDVVYKSEASQEAR